MENKFCYNLDRGYMLREVIVKIRLKRINSQKEAIVEVLLDSSVIKLVMSLEFIRKQRFKLKKIKRLIYVRNINGFFNKKKPIEHIVKVNIYYQGYRKKTEINIISKQKWSVILEISWLACHNPEIDWKTREVKIMKCSEECGK